MIHHRIGKGVQGNVCEGFCYQGMVFKESWSSREMALSGNGYQGRVTKGFIIKGIGVIKGI
jgi:hypothetical protein